jgi:ubiquinone/menaquinone biosynthesis C-methylase UbiE
MQRRPSQELLDTDCGTAKEVGDSLLDLRWFNRWFGGISTVRSMILAMVGRTGASGLSILEIASGEGYILGVLRREFSAKGIDLQITLLDKVRSHLPANGAFAKLAGDALSLPFADSSFDVVSSSLFLHHLPPEQAVRFARENLRVARRAVLVHDLIRHPLHLALAFAGTPFYRSRITRNDAPASVLQAYTVPEVTKFFQAAGAGNVDAHAHYLYRMGVIAWRDGRG